MINDKRLERMGAISSIATVMNFIGENSFRDGTVATPKRYVQFLEQFTKSEQFEFTCFENEGHDEMVIVKNIQFYSLCEHHMLPFFGTAVIAYIPNDRIVGISKLPRVLKKYCSKLQNQERIGTQVAAFIMDELVPKGVAVLLTARHMCMEMRGIQAMGAETVTSTMTGCFKNDIKCRNEFLILAK